MYACNCSLPDEGINFKGFVLNIYGPFSHQCYVFSCIINLEPQSHTWLKYLS